MFKTNIHARTFFSFLANFFAHKKQIQANSELVRIYFVKVDA